MNSVTDITCSPWPHRLAVALALVTFPLIWVGGLVTTYDAGMAVPDWPGTYGYNLFAYPLSTWLAGPWDLFIEHGHRLLGAAAGLFAIALVAVTWMADRRSWLRYAAVGALLLVIVQGVIGGARVLLDERLAAMLHAAIGPLFFAYLAGLVVCTSRFWNEVTHLQSSAHSRLVTAVWITVGLAYTQLLLGAVLRHVPLMASPQVFRIALVFHLVIAVVLAVQATLTAWQMWHASVKVTGLRGVGSLVPLLVLAQIVLGLATYVAKYSWPSWMGDYQFAAAYVVQEKSLAQSLITTAHVALGSLILFTSVSFAMRSTRIFSDHESASQFAMSRYSVLSTQYSVLNTPRAAVPSVRAAARGSAQTHEAA
jgi:cytochrome c oxidase assembly protein subunit 15